MSYFYVIDAFQTILGITDEEGMLVCKNSYSSYGIVSITMDTGGIGALNPIRYKGYYYDNERQLYCIANIYYSPTLARFIQPIDISNLNTSNINGLNLYSYANNNPIHKADKILLCDQIRVSNLMGGNPIRLRFSKPTIASFVHIAVM